MEIITDQIHEISLDQIRPSPWNPSSRLDPTKVQELANSLKRAGQKSAALVRPVETEGPVKYEIVFGHRRYAAKQLLAQTDASFAVLRAEIQEMSAEQAMITAGIENLQREDFSDLEEAEFFRTCGEQYGESVVKILSEKLSVSHRYIRKRIEILRLPDAALELWRSGAWHVGHMDQLLRLGENERVLAFLESLEGHHRKSKDLAVWQLKDLVDRLAVPLHSGNFDKTDCKACRKNTDCQRRLFGGETEKGAKCLDQECFKQKQQAWLDLNWLTCKENRFGTQAAIIGDYGTKITGEFSDWGIPKPAEKCHSCPHYTTVLALAGERHYRAYRDKACLGKADCFAEVQKAGKKSQKQDKGKQDSNAPRVAWHGEHFRQQFYQQEIPELMTGLSAEDPRRLQVALAAIIYPARFLHEWFSQKIGQDVPTKEEWESSIRLPFHSILQLARTQDARQAEYLIAEASVMIALQNGYEATYIDVDRQALAEFLDIDFSRYQVTEEYLKKKTKAELVRFIVNDSGLMQEAEFQEAMELRGIPNIEKLAHAKKGVLVDLILQCQVDLHGRLPKEIANRPEL